ncbi:5-amino-6-(5-phosphoribosylamino)uracil reductase [Haloechinothrix alba]|uniref:5-amino-6-(5-phosphoribosylamino)uracil reductase n=1 Tax=Haloechinothrix alba TaxID=664784 RepID=A0A238V5I2_9PSEU|nr:dihydrofolate reductase family protein [Haloechinothrix alba]SNR28789.1 5-amino-6-(5-phosphoribosylamino)uracil reductase [Haloechinothrix alba]
MSPRPYVVLSVASSLDGYIDDAGDTRLVLSNEEDLDRVDGVRAEADAILVGAHTVRSDDPRLLVRSPQRRQSRLEAGRKENPTKVAVTSRGDLDPTARFFTTGTCDKLVYTAAGPAADRLRDTLDGLATVVEAGEPVDLSLVLADLSARGIERLLVEGGTRILTQFLDAGAADELHLVYAPVFLGDPEAPRLPHPGPATAGLLRLAETRTMGDVVLLRYVIGRDDD